MMSAERAGWLMTLAAAIFPGQRTMPGTWLVGTFAAIRAVVPFPGIAIEGQAIFRSVDHHEAGHFSIGQIKAGKGNHDLCRGPADLGDLAGPMVAGSLNRSSCA